MVPVPVRATIDVLALVELLLIAICPVAAPADVGLNCTCSVIACGGFSVTGRPAPTIEKPVPETAAEVMITGAVPVEVSVKD